MSARLISHKPVGFNWEFEFDNGKVVSLKERADWPMLIGQPVELVEPWLLREYGWALGFLTVLDSPRQV